MKDEHSGHTNKLLRKSINGPYRLERIVVIDLSRLDKNSSINEIWDDKKTIRFNKWNDKKRLTKIDFIYHIDHLLGIVFSSIRGKPPLSNNRYDKFIDFRSLIHRFQFETIYPREFAYKLCTPEYLIYFVCQKCVVTKFYQWFNISYELPTILKIVINKMGNETVFMSS